MNTGKIYCFEFKEVEEKYIERRRKLNQQTKILPSTHYVPKFIVQQFRKGTGSQFVCAHI